MTESQNIDQANPNSFISRSLALDHEDANYEKVFNSKRAYFLIPASLC